MTEPPDVDSFSVMAEPPRPLTVARKTDVLRAAVAAAPQATKLRGDLVDGLMVLERFEEALETLDQWPDALQSFRAQMLLASCRLVAHDPANDAAAHTAASHAVGLAKSHGERASALALRGKAERRLGEVELARETLSEALAQDRFNIDACKRLAALMFENDDAPAVLALTDELLSQGVAHPQLLNSRAVAQARLGRLEEARDTIGFEKFVDCSTLATPPGFASLAAFNAAVAMELANHPARRVDPHGSASRATTRVDSPTSGQAPLATLLVEQIARAVARYVDDLPDSDHPWRRARPAGGLVHGTCAITGPAGFETWHIHQQGWLSGVYYIAVPGAVIHGTGSAGCIAFGLDDAFAGVDAAGAFGETQVRPRPGMLIMFPSHCYHRTFPHGAPEPRICMAFDVWPL